MSAVLLPSLPARLREVFRALWRFTRAVCGDSAYETYLARPEAGPRLSREAFYLDSLHRCYDGPSRCC